MTGTKVHILDADGRIIFNRLFDSGEGPLLFEGSGFIDRFDVKRRRWTIVPGWPDVYRCTCGDVTVGKYDDCPHCRGNTKRIRWGQPR